MNRLPALSEQQWSDEQRQLAEEIINGPRGALLPPFEPLLRSPELMAHAQRMGSICATVARLGSDYQNWQSCLPRVIGRNRLNGLFMRQSPGKRDRGRRCRPLMNSVYRRRWRLMNGWFTTFASSCISIKKSAMISGNRQSTLGEKGVVDLIGINGYYSFLSMIMNGAQTPVPDTRDFIPA
jgi:4-carboxymuconolactone decarboxylase